MDLDKDTIKVVSEFAEALNAMKPYTLVGFIVLILIICIVVGVVLWHKRRMLQLEQLSKNQRNQDRIEADRKIALSLEKLSKTIVDHEARSDKAFNRVTKFIAETITSHEEKELDVNNQLYRTLQEIVNRTRGVINTEDSIRIVANIFDNYIVPEFKHIAEQTLELNHYDQDPAFVKDKVSEALAKVMSNAFTELKQYKINFDVGGFFLVETRVGTVGSFKAYLLVDMIWSMIEGLHKRKYADHSFNEEQRLAKIDLDINRSIHHYFDQCKVKVARLYEDPTKANTDRYTRQTSEMDVRHAPNK